MSPKTLSQCSHNFCLLAGYSAHSRLLPVGPNGVSLIRHDISHFRQKRCGRLSNSLHTKPSVLFPEDVNSSQLSLMSEISDFFGSWTNNIIIIATVKSQFSNKTVLTIEKLEKHTKNHFF